MTKTGFILIMAMLVAGGARANEPTEPVEAVMAVTIHNSRPAVGDMPSVYLDYFAPDTLMMQYSVGFTRDLLAAVLHLKEGGSELFLGFEPILNAQDGCPVENVTYATGAEKGGVIPVTVEFDAFYCLGGDLAGTRSKVVFDVVKEGDDADSKWYVIDDIHHVADDGTMDSLRKLFGEIAKE